jgi:hypothetical protein
MRKVIDLISACLLFLVAASPVSASPILRLEQGSNVITVTDNDNDGVVGFIGTIGTYQLNLTFGTSGSTSDLSSEYALLDLISGNATGTGGTLKITLADTGYTLPAASGNVVAESDVAGTLVAPFGGALTFQSWINFANASPLPSSPTVVPVGSLALYTPVASFTEGPFECFACAFASSDTTSFSYAGGPFALFSRAIISLDGTGGVIFDQGVQVSSRGIASVPEPAAIALFGTGLLVAVGAVRRRQGAPIQQNDDQRT